MKRYERKMDSRQQSNENNKISLMGTYTTRYSVTKWMYLNVCRHTAEQAHRHKHLWTYLLYPIQITNVKASSGFILRLSCVIAVGCGCKLLNVDRKARFVFGCFSILDKIKIERIIQFRLFLFIGGWQCWVWDITRCHILPPPIRISKDLLDCWICWTVCWTPLIT